MRLWLAAMMMVTTGTRAEVAGPSLPPSQKTTPAQQAILLYHKQHDPAPPPTPCRQKSGEEIVVCGDRGGRSTDRLPLPDQSGPRAGPRTATGEMPSTAGGVGGSPALQGRGAGLTLTLKPGSAKVSGNED